jgi:hypothetical protein
MSCGEQGFPESDSIRTSTFHGSALAAAAATIDNTSDVNVSFFIVFPLPATEI